MDKGIDFHIKKDIYRGKLIFAIKNQSRQSWLVFSCAEAWISRLLAPER